VLSDFRDRLAEDGRADRLLDLMLARLKEAGLVKARGGQRTDSTRVVSAGRELTRLELVTEAVRALLEHLATAAPQILDELVTADWSQRYGRQVRMCSQPSHPVARLTQVGADADVLLERVYDRFGEQVPPQADVLRRLLIQNFWTDARGKFRPRTERDGPPPSRIRIQSSHETEARWVRRGDTRWTGYLLHVTETCDEDRVNVVTDVATWVSQADSQALPGIHGRLKKRRLLPAEHLVDGGYASGAGLADADRNYKIALVGPIHNNNSKQAKAKDGFAKENFIIDFDQREVTCPNGKVSGNWNEIPSMAPYTVVRFGKRQCGPCPEKAKCTSGEARTINFLPRRIHELQERNRDNQQDSPLAQALRQSLRRRGRHRRVRRRTPSPPLPLPRPGQDARPARPDRDRGQHRTAQPARTRRLRLPAPAAHSLPTAPRHPRPTPPDLVAPREGIMMAQDSRQSPSMARSRPTLHMRQDETGRTRAVATVVLHLGRIAGPTMWTRAVCRRWHFNG
jgi:hypothetical protein